MTNNTLETLLGLIGKLAEIEDNPDSLTIGTPSKGGEVKVYGNCMRDAEFKDKLDRAERLRLYSQELRAKGDAGELAHGYSYPDQ